MKKEEDLLMEILKKLHQLKKYGVRVIPELLEPQPLQKIGFHGPIPGKSFEETYDTKPNSKISVGKSWSSEFINELLKRELNYCKLHQQVQDAKKDNIPMMELLREFNFKKFKKDDNKDEE